MNPAMLHPRHWGRGGRALRLGYGRIFHEANAFSPLPTSREDFERLHLLEGSALGETMPLHRFELGRFLRNAELSGFVQAARLAGRVETVPLLSAFAVPGGALSRETFDSLVEGLLSRLRAAGDLDGLYLALHGSMRVQGLTEAPEAEILRRVRAVVGRLPIAVSLDLHANLTPALLAEAPLLGGYRTCPHWDLFPTGFRAGSLLVRALRGQVRPVSAWRKLPLVLGGGVGIDFLAPMRAVFGLLGRIARRPGILDATLFMVHPYSEAPDLGWAAHVLADGDPGLAEAAAEELAEAAWAVRRAPLPRFFSPAEALAEVARSRVARALGAISLVDVGDIVGTGSPGGSTHLLSALLEDSHALRVLVPLHDPAAVNEAWAAGPGRLVSLVLRGTPGLPPQPVVSFDARVAVTRETEFGRTALLEAGGLRIALAERPPLTLHPQIWRDLGEDPRAADAIVQKSFFHYRLFYALVSPRHLPVSTPGPSSLDNVRGLRLEVPSFPLEDPRDWREGDRRLRGS